MISSDRKEVVVVTGASAGYAKLRIGPSSNQEKLCSSANSLVELRVFRGYMLYRG